MTEFGFHCSQVNQKMMKTALIKDLYLEIDRLKQGFKLFQYSIKLICLCKAYSYLKIKFKVGCELHSEFTVIKLGKLLIALKIWSCLLLIIIISELNLCVSGPSPWCFFQSRLPKFQKQRGVLKDGNFYSKLFILIIGLNTAFCL